MPFKSRIAMKYYTKSELKIKKASGTFTIPCGKVIECSPGKAAKLIAEGKLAPLKEPYFEADGNLVIPFDSDPKYHWWNGGQSISKTINELTIPEATK